MSQASKTAQEFSSGTSGKTSANNRKSTYNHNKLRKRLRRLVGQAAADFKVKEKGDRVMVCPSGGKDSCTMLDILLHLRRSAPIEFEIIAVNLEQKQPGFPEHVLPEHFESLGVPYYVLERDTYSVVRSIIPVGETTCGLRSRLRRGTLYGFAKEIGAHKIALGYHRDDIVETLFFDRKLKAMPPKLLRDNKKNVVIRPLAYCKERNIEAFADEEAYPIIPCNLCGSQENLQRVEVKWMLRGWEKQYQGWTEIIFKSLANGSPSQLADRELFDFESLAVRQDHSTEPELSLIRTVSL